MSLFDLSGQVAVITGSTKGIGLGVAQQMAAQGARVIVSSRDQAACDEAARQLNETYATGDKVAAGLALDLDKLDQIAAFAQRAVEVWGRLDHLVCNAAVLPYIGRGADTPPELFDRILTTNVHHNYRLAEALRPAITEQRGTITFIGSIAGHSPAPKTMAYGAAKAGLAHLARSMADEMAPEGVRVNCIAPGLIRSASSSSTLGEQGFAAAAKGIPLRRIGEPEDIAGAVIFLASRAGSYVTGATILVDGGRAQLAAGTDTLKAVEGKSYD